MTIEDRPSSPASPLTSTGAEPKYSATATTSRSAAAAAAAAAASATSSASLQTSLRAPPSALSTLASSPGTGLSLSSRITDDARDDVPDLRKELLTAASDSRPTSPTDSCASHQLPLHEHDPAYMHRPQSLFARVIQMSKVSVTILFVVTSSVSITTTQLIGYPLWYVSHDWYRAWMDWTKQLFGILLTSITQFNTPLTMYMTGNRTVEGTFTRNPKSGHLETHIGDRAIVISNHQLYTDWVYLWWFAMTAHAHGSIYIMLKKSLAKIPLWGWGMKNYRFFFLSRSWAQDEKILTEGLSRINTETQHPAWILLFPEGTTISANGVNKTVEYANKFTPPLSVPKHVLIPRARGLRFSLSQLHSTVDTVYDATIYYEGIPTGQFGEDFYSMKSMYVKKCYPRRIHMYWRAYKVVDIPWQDEAQFEAWLQARWQEKDLLLDKFRKTGQFGAVPAVAPAHVAHVPATYSDSGAQIEQEREVEQGPSEVIPTVMAPVELNSVTEVAQIFIVPVTVALLGRLGYKAASLIWGA